MGSGGVGRREMKATGGGGGAQSLCQALGPPPKPLPFWRGSLPSSSGWLLCCGYSPTGLGQAPFVLPSSPPSIAPRKKPEAKGQLHLEPHSKKTVPPEKLCSSGHNDHPLPEARPAQVPKIIPGAGHPMEPTYLHAKCMDTSGSPFRSITMHEKTGQNCKMPPLTALGHRSKCMALFAKSSIYFQFLAKSPHSEQ